MNDITSDLQTDAPESSYFQSATKMIKANQQLLFAIVVLLVIGYMYYSYNKPVVSKYKSKKSKKSKDDSDESGESDEELSEEIDEIIEEISSK
jgi:large-conductance mechanosensitive channel